MADAYQNKLEVLLSKIASEHSYENCEFEITPISTGGANYSSILFVGKISAPDKSDLKFFAKVALFGESLRSMMASNFYKTEQYFYSKIADIFKKIQDKYDIPEEERLRVPKMYGYDATEYGEVMVLQDLAAEGFVLHDRLRSFDWEYASGAMQQLARLHALSIALQLTHSNYMSPDEFEEIKNTLQLDAAKHDALMKHTEGSLEKSTMIIKEENRELVRKYLAKNYWTIMNGLKTPRGQQVMLHGDFRMSNIMHKAEEDGKLRLMVLDYQTLLFGSPIVDLMYFIFTGSDGQFRRLNFHPLLDYYHDQLSLSLARLDLNPAKIFPKHEFDRQLKQHFGIGLIFAFLSIPVMTVDTSESPALDENLTFATLMNMTPSELCAARLNEVVHDFITWGIL